MIFSRIVPIVCVLAAIGIFFGYINPTYTGHIAKLSADIKSYDNALSAAKRFNEKESELSAAYAAIPADSLNHLAAYLPDSVDNVQLILDLNSLASRSGLKLSNFNVESSPASTAAVGSANPSNLVSFSTGIPVDSITISVTAIGTYGALHTFLAGIEKSLRPLDLTDMTLQASATGLYTYQLSFHLYWLHS